MGEIMFEIMKNYSRKKIKEMIGLPQNIVDSNLNYYSFGYPKYKDTFYIFANIGISGSTGHDYDNRFIDENFFIWTAPFNTNSDQKNIKALLANNFKRLLFTRYNNKDDFIYQGILNVCEVLNNSSPVKIKFSLIKSDSTRNFQDYILSNDISYNSLKRKYKINKFQLYKDLIDVPIRPFKTKTNINVYSRNKTINFYVKRRANGLCELCGEFAPFITPDGEPYLEVHHIVQLSNKGDDKVYNCVALCPNCHKELHYGKLSVEKINVITKILYKSLISDSNFDNDTIKQFKTYHKFKTKEE